MSLYFFRKFCIIIYRCSTTFICKKGMKINMKTFENKLSYQVQNAMAEHIFQESALFVDIETTGFSSVHTHVYLIGCAFRCGEKMFTRQFFAESKAQEAFMISAFLQFAKDYQTLITFNGLGFDIPYLQGRCRVLNIEEDFSSFSYIDIYKIISPYKKILKLSNLKQKTIESYLGIVREDTYTGGELINVYHEYINAPNEEKLLVMQLHNYEDVTGMVDLIPILSYVQFLQGNFEIASSQKHSYEEYEGGQALELIFTLTPAFPLPKRISYGYDDIYLSGYRDKVRLKIKIYQGELKYFYSNYRDYYYLPQEDIAVHKSVAFYVDKNYRTRAKAATCYSKRTGCFLPQYEEVVLPYFKLEYHDKHSFFEMTEDLTNSKETQKNYIIHLLNKMR